MFKQRIVLGVALFSAMILGIQAEGFAFAKVKKKQATFVVRIENVAPADGLAAADGSMYPFALSPGLYTTSDSKVNLFRDGKKADPGLEAQAEDGNPEVLFKKYLTKIGGVHLGTFTKPVGSEMPSPIFSGGAYEFTFTATEGSSLDLTTMFGQSNDLFYAPAKAIELFDDNGQPVTGDITDKFELWDAGTEVNQAPGIGADQGPRQKGPNTGAAENGVVHLVKDAFTYPETKNVLRITVSVK
jgi:hypothetical protein